MSLVAMEKLDKREYPFLISRIEEAELTEVGSRIYLDIRLPENPVVAVDRDGRKLMENGADHDWLREQLSEFERGGHARIATPENPLRWSAGGLLHTDANRYLVMIKKDENAPSFPGYQTSATGLSQSIEEWREPLRVVLREGFEEIVYFNEGIVLVPIVQNVSAKIFPKDVIRRSLREIGIREYEEITVPVEYRTDTDTVVRVYHKNDLLSETCGVVSIDPETSGITVLGIAVFDADFSKFTPLDTEVARKEGGSVHLDRTLYLVKYDEIKGKSAGEEMEVYAFRSRQGLGYITDILRPSPALYSGLEFLGLF
jgi:hypothetical protein